MYMRTNVVRQAYKEGRPCFGCYIRTPAPRMVEMLAFAGMDFIRVDMDGVGINLETVENMIRTAHAVGVTPFVRLPSNDEAIIHAVLKMGAMGLIIPRVRTVEDVQKAIDAAKLPPDGHRHVTPGDSSGGYGRASQEEYLNWYKENIILSVQLETAAGVENVEEIVALPGLDMVQSGRGDLSFDMGLVGQQYHPDVMAAQRKTVEAALKAGKMVGLQHFPLKEPQQMEWIRDWIKEGVYCHSLGGDYDVVAVYRQMLNTLKQVVAA